MSDETLEQIIFERKYFEKSFDLLTNENYNLKEQYKKMEDHYFKEIKKLHKENKELKEQLKKEKVVNSILYADEFQQRIDKAIEYIKKHLEAKSYSNHKYELFDRKYLEDILKLLNGER